jgi:hypothetical protein
MVGVGKSINCISVVEGLGAKSREKKSTAVEGRAVVYVLVGLDDPDELLDGVVEVELDLVGRRTNRLVTGELQLSNQILVRVLGHTTTLVSVKEDVVNVEGSSYKRLVVGNCGGLGARYLAAVKGSDSPQALINRANIKVNLYFVVLYETTFTPPFGVFIGILISINYYL